MTTPAGRAPGGAEDSPTLTGHTAGDRAGSAGPAQPVPSGTPVPPPGSGPGFRPTRRMSLIAAAVLAVATAATVIIVAVVGGTPHGRKVGAPQHRAVLYAYVANYGDGTVTRISLATGQPGTPITVGKRPARIAITPSGATAYVVNLANFGDSTASARRPAWHPHQGWARPGRDRDHPQRGRLRRQLARRHGHPPISLATGQPGTPISIGKNPAAIAISRSS